MEPAHDLARRRGVRRWRLIGIELDASAPDGQAIPSITDWTASEALGDRPRAELPLRYIGIRRVQATFTKSPVPHSHAFVGSVVDLMRGPVVSGGSPAIPPSIPPRYGIR